MEIFGGFWLQKPIEPAINCSHLLVLHARMQA